jgi:hypothetical protein
MHVKGSERGLGWDGLCICTDRPDADAIVLRNKKVTAACFHNIPLTELLPYIQ